MLGKLSQDGVRLALTKQYPRQGRRISTLPRRAARFALVTRKLLVVALTLAA
jgi:hypothetical protein